MKSDADRRKEALKWFRDRCEWLHDDAHVDYELARGIVRASAVWFQRDAGPVAVPGQAEHVTWGAYGWRIYSSNSFELTLFVKAARKIILSAYEDAIAGRAPKTESLVAPIASCAHGCVSGHDDGLFRHYGHGRFVLAFGSQAIMAEEAARFLLEASGYTRALRWTPGRRRDATAKTPPKSPPPQPTGAPKPRSTPKKAKAQPRQQERPRDPNKKTRVWVDRMAFDANKRYGPLPKRKKKSLRALLNKLAPLEVHGAKTPERERERDQLWLQIRQLLKGDAPPASRPPEPPEAPPPSGSGA